MLTPFDYEAVREHISELIDGLFRPLKYVNDFEFEIVTREMTQKDASDLRKTLKQTSELSKEEIEKTVEEMLNDRSVDAEIGCEIWADACLLDDALNGMDYSSECIGYADEYRKALEMLKQDISKKKFLSKKPVYNLSVVLQNGIDALDCVLGINYDSELAEEMKQKGSYSEFENLIIDLQNRLSRHIDYEQLADGKITN